MTVAELIEELKKFPSEMTVLVRERFPILRTGAVWAHEVKQETLGFAMGKIDKDNFLNMGFDRYIVISSCDKTNIEEYKKIQTIHDFEPLR